MMSANILTGGSKSNHLVRKTACSRGQRRISGITSSGKELATGRKKQNKIQLVHEIIARKLFDCVYLW